MKKALCAATIIIAIGVCASFMNTMVSLTPVEAKANDAEKYGHYSTVLSASGQLFTGEGVLKTLTITPPSGGTSSLFEVMDDTDGSTAAVYTSLGFAALPMALTHEVNIRFANGAYFKESGDGTSWYVTATYYK